MAWGTDVLFSRALAQRQGAILASLIRWYTPAEALAIATGTNAELLSGKRNPCPGRLGVVEEGALADLLLVDGDPLDDLGLIADPHQGFQDHHEGRHNLQEHSYQVRICRACFSELRPRLSAAERGNLVSVSRVLTE
jgi:hypothetical protein